MLLGDAERRARGRGGAPRTCTGAQHRRGDADEPRGGIGEFDHLVGEDARPGLPAGRFDRLARLRVDPADAG
jgi:hypothetical protein